ncbi:MAG: bacteriophage Gp15 family protein [Clostridia bacterium]
MPDLNILIDPLPLTVCVGGRDVPISSGFRTGILFEMLMLDKSIRQDQKAALAIGMYFGDEVPEPINEAVEQMMNFYACGKDEDVLRSVGKGTESKTKRCYDYDIDAPYIYAAFLSQYRIDLQDVDDLHWWKFMAMFLGLNDDNEICKIMEYRSVDLAKIKNKAERERYAKLKHKYALPDTRTSEQKAMDIGAMLGGMIK